MPDPLVDPEEMSEDETADAPAPPSLSPFKVQDPVESPKLAKPNSDGFSEREVEAAPRPVGPEQFKTLEEKVDAIGSILNDLPERIGIAVAEAIEAL